MKLLSYLSVLLYFGYQSPCDTLFLCTFGAQCRINATNGEAYCYCPMHCDTVFAPVCGTDSVTYTNECQLKKQSCIRQHQIKIKLSGICGKRDPCQDHPCDFGARCVPSLGGTSYRCACQTRCDSYGDNVGSTPVCGNNGADYNNICELKKESCDTMMQIRVKYYGKCDPCDGFKCENGEVCRLDKQRKPVCRCNFQCDDTFELVCGTDARTYSNKCTMRREACKENSDVEVLHAGRCSPGNNPCDKIHCAPEEDCSVDRQGRASCTCPPPCEPVIRHVCGDDRRTYDSLCELRRQSCMSKKYVVMEHTGQCGNDVPCRTHHCDYDATCVVMQGKLKCECPMCSEEYDPVCGEGGMTYTNECKLRQENCNQKSKIRVKHQGSCDGCENVKCEYYAVCNSDGQNAECVCPISCLDTDYPVCGSNGRTYQNECQLKVSSCRYSNFITVASIGACDQCRDTNCKFGARCENGYCVCPILCPTVHEPICASNGRTYNNECDMRRDACSTSTELDVEFSGECDVIETSGSGEDLEGSGDDSMDACDETKCSYGGKCAENNGGKYSCECQLNCPAIRFPVCGSDNKMYPNECQLKYESCRLQQPIRTQDLDNCDDLSPEEPCDGNTPMMNTTTGEEFECSAAKFCPAGSYCHRGIGFAKCCKEENSILRCGDTPYGCCSDGLTASPGSRGAGCPEYCHCNSLGSYRTTCHPLTRQCTCKPGVGGERCDRCVPGSWGLHKIAEDGNVGCIPCNCNVYGSMRDDCDQMTGRCICRPNIGGMKCNLCPDRKLLGPLGCEERPKPTSCAELDCKFGSICQQHNGRLECICDYACEEFDTHDQTVCGTDGKNYGSECQLRTFGCRLQQYIDVAYYGSCRE